MTSHPPDPFDGFEGWPLQRVGQAVEAGKFSVNHLAGLRAELGAGESLTGASQEQPCINALLGHHVPGWRSPMTDRGQMQIIFHGAILLFAGLVCGVPFAIAAGNAWGDEAVRAWRVAHTGAVTIGVALIAIGGIAHRLALGEGAGRVLVTSLLGAGYTFGPGIVIAAVAGTRGLGPTGPAVNVVVFLAYISGTIATFVASSLIIPGAYTSLHRRNPV